MMDSALTPHPLLRIMAVHRLIEAQLRAAFTPLGLHVGQEHLLIMLAQHGTLNMARLVENLDMKAPTLTKMVERLEAQGFVEKRADELDGRRFNIRLTAAGEHAALQAEKIHATLNAQIEEILGEKDAKKLRKALKKVLRAFE